MPPQPRLAIIATVQQAISDLLMTYEPEFLRFGNRLFLAFATIVIAWHGIEMMFSRDGLGDSLFEFARLLLVVSIILFVLLFYFCNPPFVGYFYSIPTEGSYLIVNKNLVEVCALVVILVTGSGRFAGLDRILHGLFARRPRLAAAASCSWAAYGMAITSTVSAIDEGFRIDGPYPSSDRWHQAMSGGGSR